MDFQQGDVGYIEISRPHYVENTGEEDLMFLEVFPVGTYQDNQCGGVAGACAAAAGG